MLYSYKLFKVKNKFLHYGFVSIEILPTFEDQNIIDFGDAVLQTDEYISRLSDLSKCPSLLDASVQGISDTLYYFNNNICQKFFEIRIKQIIELITDTHDGDIKAASSAVAWHALGLDASQLKFLFLPNHTTKVIFPKDEDLKQHIDSNLIVLASEAGIYSDNL